MNMNLQDMTIAVLLGGWSEERAVSLEAGAAIVQTLKEAGYKVHAIDVQKDLHNFMTHITAIKPDVVFNGLYGTGGEDGVIQGVLTMLGVPYTHSGVLTSAVAMDKRLCHYIFESNHIPMAPFKIVPYDAFVDPFDFPYVMKPIDNGSSCGVFIPQNDAERDTALQQWHYGPSILCEKYIPGREIQVAVYQGKALGAIEIKPVHGFYDYNAKYTENQAEHIMPAPLSADYQALLYSYAEKAHTLLNCKGFTRSDFRLDESSQTITLLEINTQPGMHPLSLLPEIAAYHGMSFVQILEGYLNEALSSYNNIKK